MSTQALFSVDIAMLPHREADFLIIGSGIAGLFAAYQAARLGSVLVVTKERVEDSNTGKAQGGIAAAVDEADSPFYHLEDTLEAGAGLCDPETVEILVNEGPQRVMELVKLGVNFDREGSAWALGREGAHRRRRILHATDATGGEIARALITHCRQRPEITISEGCVLVDFLRAPDDGRLAGALVLDKVTGGLAVCRGRVTIVATGGAGRLYCYTTNPEVATGDGMAAAYRAGAELMDMEFVQFHPTALTLPGAPRFLISEAVRGEGAQLRNIKGERFMHKYHQMKELAPRDVVARAIVREMKLTGADHVYLDLTPVEPEHFRKRFPNIWRTCQEYGCNPDEGSIPVAPAAHYLMGGIRTNGDGESNIPGLYACGEVACEGVHGANRLASNSLLEGLVFGARAVAAARCFIERHPELPELPACTSSGDQETAAVAEIVTGVQGSHSEVREIPQVQTESGQSESPEYSVAWKLTPDWGEICDVIRRLMWEKSGIIRCADGLAEGIAQLERIKDLIPEFTPTQQCIETASLLTLGTLHMRAALMRTESRGGHFRRDYPSRDDRNWLKHLVFKR